MAMTLHYSQTTEPHLLDIVDEEWARDTLPADDIPLPDGVQPPVDDSDEFRDEAEPQPREPEKWPELGLNTLQ